MIRFFAHFLFLLAAWTLLIKYVFPIAWAINYGEPLLTHVMWDFWWVAHIWLGWAFLNWQRYTFALAIGVSLVEIIIVVSKFILFLSEPDWTIWTTNWFINKVFVLACFIMILGYFSAHWRDLSSRSQMASSNA